MNRKSEITNPIAHADGGVGTGKTAGKQIKLEAPKLPSTSTGSAGSEQKQKPYTPVKCEMWTLPKYKTFNFSQKGGDTITFNKYVENCMAMRIPRNTLPVGEVSMPKVYFLLNIDSAAVGSPQALAAQGFWRAYTGGFIQGIYAKINEFFSDRKWFEEYRKNPKFYRSKEKGGFVWNLIEENIFAADVLKNPQSDVFENTKVAILRFIMYPEAFETHAFSDMKSQNDDYAKKIRDKITKTDAMDFLTLGINRINKAASESYFNEEYSDKITEPNKKIYEEAKEKNDKRTTFEQAFKANINQLTDDETEDRKIWSDSAGGDAKGEGYSSGSGSGSGNKNSDKTMLLVAVCVLAGILFLKKKYRS